MRSSTESGANDGKQRMRLLLESLLTQLEIAGPKERAGARVIEAALADPAALVSLAAGPPVRLGEMLRSAGRIKEDQVAKVLAEQGRSGVLFGELLVRGGHLSAAERDAAIEFQRLQQVAQGSASPLRLGEILVAGGQVSRAALDESLARQRSTGRRLGEELVAASHATAADVDAAVSVQKRLVSIAFVLALAAVAGSPMLAIAAPAQGAPRASVSLTVRIPVAVQLRSISQGDAVTITAADIQKGFVEVPAGSRFELVANSPHTMHFAAQGSWFRAVRVSGLGGDLTLGATGGEFLQTHGLPNRETHELDYRFELSPGALPGRYAWPLTLSVSAA